MTNPYAPPQAAVRDIVDPSLTSIVADRGTRFGAAILDGFIFGLMVYMPFIAGVGVSGANRPPENPEAVTAAVGIGFILGLIGFVAWSAIMIVLLKRNGQSIGKKATGIKMVRSDGSTASLSRLIWLRGVVNSIINIIPFYFFIDSLFIFGESRQCLHDKIADTIVVKA
jgi:uncharacterized RDD family membrane protein YckC